MRAVRFSVVTAVATAAALTAVTGCAEKSDGKGDGAVKVTAKDDSCAVSKKKLPAGHIALAVENKGSKVTEVYVLFPDDRIVAERENIGPGTKGTITAEVKAGSYDVVCKPGMKGAGFRQKIEVTGGTAVKRSPEMDKAVAGYRTYVQAQADETLPKVKVFTDAVAAGDIEAAKKAYADSASAGSAPSRSPSRSVTSTRRSTSARTAWRTARSGPAGTAWRRRCGRTRSSAPRRRPSPRSSTRTWSTGRSGSARRRSPRPRWPTAPRSSSTRSPPAR